MSTNQIPSYTPLLFSKTGVCIGIHIFLTFAPKHRLGVRSIKPPHHVPTIYDWAKIRKISNFSTEKFHFLQLKKCILHDDCINSCAFCYFLQQRPYNEDNLPYNKVCEYLCFHLVRLACIRQGRDLNVEGLFHREKWYVTIKGTQGPTHSVILIAENRN